MTHYIPTPSSTINPGWSGRNQRLSNHIAADSSVLDLGCGSKDLLRYISPSSYCGIDHVTNEFADAHMDLNSDFVLPGDQWDYIVCSGLLEYLADISHFFFRIKHKANKYVFTYWKNATEHRSGITNANAPRNIHEFEDLLRDHFDILETDAWQTHNIYVCRTKNAGKILNTYWYTEEGSLGNCGDLLGPYILEKYGYTCILANRKWADIYCVGSIAESAHPGSTVLGSGIIKKDSHLSPDAKWLWVRGPLTRNRVIECGGHCPEIYGDAALLMPRMFKGSAEKIHDIGIVSHYIDYADLKQLYPDAIIINMETDNLEKTIHEITQCRRIVSSSLHGIILANAYNIPAAWFKLNPLYGDNVKFEDYALSLHSNLPLSTVENPIFINPHVDTTEIHTLLANLS